MHVAAHQRAVDEKAVGGHLEAVIARSVSDEAIHTSLPPRGSMDCFAFARSDADDIVVIPVAIYGRLIYREPRSARRFERQQEWIPPPLQHPSCSAPRMLPPSSSTMRTAARRFSSPPTITAG